jgi:TolB-like protein
VGILPLRCVGLPEDANHLGLYFANEITAQLWKFRWLSVISSNSLAPSARETHDGTAALRRAFDLDFLLDGAIQRSRNKLRITMRLLDLKEDNQVVWARRFDGPADDPLTVQEEVSSEVAAQIDPIILLTEAKRVAMRNEPASSAQDLILRSIPLITRLERDSFMRAGANLARAVEMEPDHSAPHGWYATWYVMLSGQGWTTDPEKAVQRAGELADRAILLDPYSVAAFSVAGHVRAFLNRRPNEGAALHERALELNPNFAMAWALSSMTLMLLGDTEKAERRYQRYKALSPLDPYSFMFDGMFAANHLIKHDYQAAAAIGRAVTQLKPSYSAGYKPYLAALGHLGEAREMETVLRRLMVLEPNITIQRCLAAYPMRRKADQDHFAEGLRRAQMP